ncbi:MAG: pyridinium-3,5-bisthiocarboxylic acid mononucleotide nickel chelatase [Frankiaceae bacterium]|jgi:uncharacterized protein (TIGR00299 family) protein|nr:pyridinium-3,5-bisthiocarboxylic acid mononucleotide nickel chelatase [Frankiaceae bacterium]
MLWLNPVNGISGDMLLGALLDLGAPLGEVRAAVTSTGVDGWRLDCARVDAGGLQAMHAVVTVDPAGRARSGRDVLEAVRRARPAAVATIAADAVSALLRVEAELHGVSVADVHLHELGGVDTVVDTVGVAAAVVALGIDDVLSGPVALGSGTVATAHGTLPVPAPATLALLRGARVAGTDIVGEAVTPTGAALLLALGASYEPLPPVRIVRSGYGAGTRRLPSRPNVLPAALAERVGAVASMTVLETNVDDVTGELLAHVLTAAIAAGAADAWITPVVMKKGRPAHTVHALVDPSAAAAVTELLLRETGSLGVRRTSVDRVAVERSVDTVTLGGHAVRVKRGPWGAKAEWDDVVSVAASLGRPARAVAADVAALLRTGPESAE